MDEMRDTAIVISLAMFWALVGPLLWNAPLDLLKPKVAAEPATCVPSLAKGQRK